ncbi:hypothetical protein NMY22_g10450 [Coprinellus aureogranulatus]|nr:hypothetical protein NMY22_g10450 [Coprinellus aureogranulatus]
MPRKTAKYDGVLISPPIFVTATNASGHRKLYPIFKDKSSEAQLVQCDECGRFVSLQGNKSLARLERHTRSNQCANVKAKSERWNLEQRIRAEANAALVSSGLVHEPTKPPTQPRVAVTRPIVEAPSSELVNMPFIFYSVAPTSRLSISAKDFSL